MYFYAPVNININVRIYFYTLLFLSEMKPGTSLVAQWLRFRAPSARGPGLIPGQGIRSHMHATTKSSHATTKEPLSRN